MDYLLLPINVVQAIALYLWTAVWCCISYVIYGIFGQDAMLIAVRPTWAPVMCLIPLGWVKLEPIPELDYSKNYVLVANHQSHLDSIVILAKLPLAINPRFLAMKGMKRVPFFGLYMMLAGMIFIDRRDRDSRRQSMEQVTEALKNGTTVLIFPQGTRQRTVGEIGEFYDGAFRCAIESQREIIPIAIEGTGRVWPPDSIKFRPGLIRVKLGRPISPDGYSLENIQELNDHVRAKIVELHSQISS